MISSSCLWDFEEPKWVFFALIFLFVCFFFTFYEHHQAVPDTSVLRLRSNTDPNLLLLSCINFTAHICIRLESLDPVRWGTNLWKITTSKHHAKSGSNDMEIEFAFGEINVTKHPHSIWPTGEIQTGKMFLVACFLNTAFFQKYIQGFIFFMP